MSSFLSFLFFIISFLAKGTTSFIFVLKTFNKKQEVTKEQAEEFARRNGLKYIETSALNGQNVEQAFMQIAQLAWQQTSKTTTAAKKENSLIGSSKSGIICNVTKVCVELQTEPKRTKCCYL